MCCEIRLKRSHTHTYTQKCGFKKSPPVQTPPMAGLLDRSLIDNFQTGESIASTTSSTRQAPVVPARTGAAAVSQFNRNIAQNMSMRSPPAQRPITHFTRSQSVRYVSLKEFPRF